MVFVARRVTKEKPVHKARRALQVPREIPARLVLRDLWEIRERRETSGHKVPRGHKVTGTKVRKGRLDLRARKAHRVFLVRRGHKDRKALLGRKAISAKQAPRGLKV